MVSKRTSTWKKVVFWLQFEKNLQPLAADALMLFPRIKIWSHYFLTNVPSKSSYIRLSKFLSSNRLQPSSLIKPKGVDMVKLVGYVFLFLVLVLTIHSARIACQEVEDESEFTYAEGSENGPGKWGDIHPEWAACKKGGLQSPIDLMDKRVDIGTHLKKLKRSYKPTNATIKNRGHDIMLGWVGGAGTIEINNTEYVLRQCHWHSPSEHSFNGKRFALELHLVHESVDKKIAVVGITYTFGRPDTFLTELMEHIGPIVTTDNQVRSVGVLNPKNIKMGSRKYYRYIGSLTIPPCTENVVWTIVQKVRTVSREQVRLLRAAVKDDSKTNSRPVQKIQKHSVHLYRPQDPEDN